MQFYNSGTDTVMVVVGAGAPALGPPPQRAVAQEEAAMDDVAAGVDGDVDGTKIAVSDGDSAEVDP